MKLPVKFTLPILAVLASISLSSAQTYVFDENNGIHAGQPAGSGIYMGNMEFYSGGTWATTLNLPAGKYVLSSNRNTTATENTQFRISTGGLPRVIDYANSGGGFVPATYLGYIESTGAPVSVLLDQNGPWGCLVDYVNFTATSDVYFDENTAGLNLVGAGTTALALTPPTVPYGFNTSLLNNAGMNGVIIETGGGSMSGTVSLNSGQMYEVFVSRQVSLFNPGNLSFDLNLGGSYFATVNGQATNGVNDSLQEVSVGFYTPSSGSVNVLLNNSGSSWGRMDYVRFSTVPEPSTIALFGMIAMAATGVMLRKRSRKE